MSNISSPKKEELRGEAALLRKQLGVDTSSSVDALRLAGDAIPDLTVVHYPIGKGISGMCIKGDSSSVIAINSKMSVGRQNFSMAHELFHLYYDTSATTTVCSTTIGSGNDVEKQADQFASYFLIPPDALFEAIDLETKGGKDLSVKNIVSLEQHFLVSRRAILFRLVQDGYLDDTQAEIMKHGVITSARESGYADTLYKPSPKDAQMTTTGCYIRQAKELLAKNLISDSKYNGLMLAALRNDLVYGKNPDGGEVVD